jgi:hypothetical protein
MNKCEGPGRRYRLLPEPKATTLTMVHPPASPSPSGNARTWTPRDHDVGCKLSPRHACEQDPPVPPPSLPHTPGHRLDARLSASALHVVFCPGNLGSLRDIEQDMSCQRCMGLGQSRAPGVKFQHTHTVHIASWPKIRTGRFDDAALDVTQGRVTREGWAG